MTSGQERTADVLLYIEKGGPETYRIESDQLEHIGAKLRGPRQFSVFHSIVLPLIVSVATVIFTGLFQFISWKNSVAVQNATDVATRAMEASEKVTVAIDRRRYATFLFISSLQDLVSAKVNPGKPQDWVSDVAATTGSGSTGAIASGRIPFARPLVGQSASLDKLDLELKRQRFEAYYEQLKRWNESIDQLLTDVFYGLDQPIFSLIAGAPEGRKEGIAEFYEKLKKINCEWSMTDSLKSFSLNPDSLKLRLAGINMCYVKLNYVLARIKSAATPEVVSDGVSYKILDEALYVKLHERLDHIHTMASEFRCYALYRADYYKQQREQSIFSPMLIWTSLTGGQRQDAIRHFQDTAKRCSPENRPT
jgi:hypothetical protein